ncbi:YqaJ viral recombinase family nuclease [Algicola sagamiensis]|uniref:YqaJ viral recombinase family nuclease n=1 Tax=Algicola sagamiensis TaxID=163869 RepID=UPI0003702A64|nr:YqaJ viral recombinase family protein [Algicola sagamiensis]
MHIQTHNDYIEKIKSTHDCTEMSEDSLWHFERSLGIGGSDVGAILGVNKYKTPYQVWLEKTGRAEPEDLSDNERVHFGNVLEDTVAQEYSRRTGCKVQRRNKPFIHAEMPWLRANLDRVVVGEKKVLECKTAGAFAMADWGEAGTDEVPESYLLQVTHYMYVLGWNKADLAVLVGGNEFRIYCFDLDEELADFIQQKLQSFWFDHVIADVPPEAQNNTDLETFYKAEDGLSTVAPPEIIEKFKRLRMIKDQIKALETEAYGPSVGGKPIGGLDFEIKNFMGKSTELLIDDEGKRMCSWKKQKFNHFDTAQFKKYHPELANQFIKPTEIRVFRA